LSYLVDTNILSELRRRQPNPGVSAWIAGRPSAGLYISVLSLGEIRRGIESLLHGDRRSRLVDWLEVELPAYFRERVLPVDERIADRWGRLVSQIGRPVPAIDSLLATTALHHDLILVTRNVRDFSYPGLEVVNPWA
jgi:hypothetical protein